MTTDHAHSPMSFRLRGGRMEGKSQVAVGRRRLATARGWLATSRWSPRLAVAALVAVMVGAAVLAYLPFTQTPSPQPASAPADVFSADRALVELRAVAAEPRPMGSTEHETAIVAIRDRLTELGVESEVVEGVATRNDFNQVFAGRLRNVIARIPGTDSTGGVLLLSHFDSVPTSMNANDGGLGVATVLETVRALQAGPPPVNDVVLWFGDADETTALNALLLQHHRWFRDVRFGFAFEAPGATGPSLLTFAGEGNPQAEPPLLSLGDNEGVSLDNAAISTDNGRWLREALDAVPHPVVALPLNDIALGASPDLGMSMWGTDVAGVSFSQIANSSGYHTDLDRPDRVSRASLQDSGESALALARHFARFDFTDAPDAGGLVAFTIPSGRVVTYPTAWAVPLALLTLAALAAVLIVAKRRHQLTVTGLLVGVATTVVAVVASVVMAVVATGLLAPDAHFARNPYGIGWRTLLLAAITLAVVATVFAGAARLLKRPARVTAIAAAPLDRGLAPGATHRRRRSRPQLRLRVARDRRDGAARLASPAPRPRRPAVAGSRCARPGRGGRRDRRGSTGLPAGQRRLSLTADVRRCHRGVHRPARLGAGPALPLPQRATWVGHTCRPRRGGRGLLRRAPTHRRLRRRPPTPELHPVHPRRRHRPRHLDGGWHRHRPLDRTVLPRRLHLDPPGVLTRLLLRPGLRRHRGPCSAGRPRPARN